MFVPNHCPYCGGHHCNPACQAHGRAVSILQRWLELGVREEEVSFLLGKEIELGMDSLLRRAPQAQEEALRGLLVPILAVREELRVEDDPAYQAWLDELAQQCRGCEHRDPCEGCQQGAGCDGPCLSCQERERLGDDCDDDDDTEEWP
jgi:hypothetical protein